MMQSVEGKVDQHSHAEAGKHEGASRDVRALPALITGKVGEEWGQCMRTILTHVK